MLAKKVETFPGNIALSHKLAYKYLEGDESLKDFFEYYPPNLENAARLAHRLSSMVFPREMIGKRALEYAISCGAAEQSIENARILADSKTLVIVTGQQPGLLTGPLYTIYKAITAAKLSSVLSAELSVPVVPVFWNGSDDHDLEEVCHFNYPHASGPRRIGFPHPSERRMMSYYFPDNANDIFKDISFIDDECIDFMKFQEQESLSRHFSRLMFWLLRDFGLVILEPWQFRDFNSPLVKIDFENHAGISGELDRTAEKLGAIGFDAQIKRENKVMNYYLIENGVRRIVDQGQALPDHVYEQTSLNVVLRPSLQHKILPVLAHVAGPGEIGYHAQMKTIQALLNTYQPIIWPRQSFTLIEPSIEKIINKFSFKTEQIFQSVDRIKTALPKPDNLETEFRDIQQRIENMMDDVFKKASYVERTLDEPARKTRQNITSLLEKFKGKTLSAWQKKQGLDEEHLQRMHYHIMPRNIHQERYYNIFYYINSFGHSLVDDFYKLCEPVEFLHKVMYL
ncbi:MAG: bacillithiol biosynthesis BshC [bacterium]